MRLASCAVGMDEVTGLFCFYSQQA